ncbi:hypothetical protein [Hyphomicrobium sp.]|uniref:hypothetical protein n=1 Tax=Hyphomicrobium sp. TaxID=82 RepID=UPI000FA348AD|nr:hypothetical protein [Hyphomicrobium sp.]MBN9247698.1 hypothetical protein [Hyphomicrobium sp.]RUP10018.1 MAG: hypothetical protein EKK38_06135 [Hyphomicrobium sp.]
MALQWIVLWGGTAIAASILAGILAGIKNRDLSYWIGWSFLVPPAVIWLLFLPKYKGPRPRQPRLDDIDRRENGPL